MAQATTAAGDGPAPGLDGVSVRELTLEHGGMTMHADSYEAEAGGAARVALLLHGFPDTKRTWRHLAPVLARRGYRAVAVAMRGYEEGSVAHRGVGTGVAYREAYTITDIAGDVAAWMDLLAADQVARGVWGGGDAGATARKFCIIGHDWGSMVAGTVVLLHPERVSHLVQMAVPHLKHFRRVLLRHPVQVLYSYYILLFQLPWVPEVLLSATSFVGRLWRTWSGPAGVAALADDAAATTRVLAGSRGIAEGALGYYRALLNPFSARARGVTKLWVTAPPIPTTVHCLALNGLEDGCIHPAVFRACTRSADCYEGWGTPLAQHVEVPAVGHWAHLERPAEVNAIVAKFLADD